VTELYRLAIYNFLKYLSPLLNTVASLSFL